MGRHLPVRPSATSLTCTMGRCMSTSPGVLLLDEPTSGLDAFNANALVQTLSALAMRRRKTVIFTIHQVRSPQRAAWTIVGRSPASTWSIFGPALLSSRHKSRCLLLPSSPIPRVACWQPRSDIFALLERVMLLSSGRCVFFGAADMLVAHLAECGFPCARFVNPLDHAIDTVVVDKRTVASEQATTARLDRLVAAYERSPQHAALQTELASAAAIAGKLGVAPLPWTRHPQRWHYTFSTVLGRQWVNLGRNPYVLIPHSHPHPQPRSRFGSFGSCPDRLGWKGSVVGRFAGSHSPCVWAKRWRSPAFSRSLSSALTTIRFGHAGVA